MADDFRKHSLRRWPTFWCWWLVFYLTIVGIIIWRTGTVIICGVTAQIHGANQSEAMAACQQQSPEDHQSR